MMSFLPISLLLALVVWPLTVLRAENAPAAPAYKRYETPPPAERAAMVKRGTEFLVKGQNENGSFGLGKEVGVTTAALHALLLNDPAYRSPENATTRKALTFLLRNVQPDGRISDPEGGYDNYKTSYALVALSTLSEADYSALVRKLTEGQAIPKEKAEELAQERVFQAAQKWLGQQQASEENGFERDKDPGYGGQGYGGVPIPDLSNSQFAMDALHATGIRRGHPFYARMEVFLNRTQNLRLTNDLSDAAKFPQLKSFQVMDDGGFGYAPGLSKADTDVNAEGRKFARSYASMTAAGLKSLLQLGVPKDDRRVQAALGWLASHYTLEINYGLDQPDKPEKGLQALYYYYWTFAKAMSELGQPKLKLADGTEILWAGELAGKLRTLQRPDGSWKNEQSRWEEADPFLVTSYCLAALHHCEKSLAAEGK